MPRTKPAMMRSIEVNPRTIIAMRMPRTCGCRKIPIANDTKGATRLNAAACLGNELAGGGAGIIGGGVGSGGGDVSMRVEWSNIPPQWRVPHGTGQRYRRCLKRICKRVMVISSARRLKNTPPREDHCHLGER